MALQLPGSKTLIVAGTPLQCIELYRNESYVINFNLKSGTPATPINTTGWTLATSAAYYTINASLASNTVTITDLTALSPTPSQPNGLAANWIDQTQGTGYLYLPTTLSPSSYTYPLTENPILLCIVTLQISRNVTPVSTSLNVVSREPIGILLRYQ